MFSNVLKSRGFQTCRIFARLLGVTTDTQRPDDYIELPQRYHKNNEDLAVRKARLLYQSRRRGMLENDILLSTFASKYLADMTLKQVEQYDQLINQPSDDWEIYYWITDAKKVPPEYDNELMRMMKEHVQNLRRETNTRMPDLE